MDLRTIELKIARGENLPVLPQVIRTVFKVADDPRATARDIEKLIEQDTALTAKVLRVVNSPAYGLSQISSVGRALAVLGLNRVRSLLMSVAFQNLMVDRRVSTQFDKFEYWRHSVAVGTAAKAIGRLKVPYRAEELFCIGIMHDIGLIVMDKFCPEVLDEVILRADRERVPLNEAELKVMNWSHAHLGATLAEKWSFGDSVKTAIQDHHNKALLTEPTNAAAIIQVADILAHQCGFGNQLPHCTYAMDEATQEAFDFSEEQLEAIKQSMITETEKMVAVFQLNTSHPPAKPARATTRLAS